MKQKQCARCGDTKPVTAFVDNSGRANPRGRYCRDCHAQRWAESRAAALAEEKAKIPRLRILYGRNWRAWTSPYDFMATLSAERDFCPYCGVVFPVEAIDCVKGSTPVIDHMDPIAKGGEDSIRNVVLVCAGCNRAKWDHLFLDWMATLAQPNQDLVRRIYTRKHGRPPEHFRPGPPGFRQKGIDAELILDEEAFNRIYVEGRQELGKTTKRE